MCVNKQDDTIREDRRQLREARVTLRGSEIRRHGAAGECLEAEQQPHGIVGHFKVEVPISGERQRDFGPFSLVRSDAQRRQASDGDRQE